MDNGQVTLKKNTDIRRTICRTFWCIIFSSLILGCETTRGPAPVVERTVVPVQQAARPSETEQAEQYYIVQKGDTFYGIALSHGINQRELAEWNNIVDPNAIRPGQRINLLNPSRGAEPTLFAVPQHDTMPIVDPTLDLTGKAPDSMQQSAPNDLAVQKIKTAPKAVKLPYSEQNMTRLQHSVNPSYSTQNTNIYPPDGSAGTRIENAPGPAEQKTHLAMHATNTNWIWPANGKLLSSFSDNAKGLKISGQMGQSIVATAAGEVVYSGDGLRGYGNLIIIKHDDALLSAYAHNSKLLVREGETVDQGQKIAEMGSTDTDTPQLHFEIRRHGKPVDPMKFLSANPGQSDWSSN